MTDKDIADRVYIEPLTVEVVEQLIKKEKPDSVLPTLGGQAALNLAMELEEAGFLKENNVRLIGTTSETIKKAEDRLEFKKTMEKIGEPCAASLVVENVEDGVQFAEEHRISGCVKTCLYTGRKRRRYRSRQSTVGGNSGKRTSPVSCWSGTGRAMHRRMERDRVRGNA